MPTLSIPQIASKQRSDKLERINGLLKDKLGSFLLNDITYPDSEELNLIVDYYLMFYFDKDLSRLMKPIHAEYSKRLTSAAGKAYIMANSSIIKISTMMLFETFDKINRDIFVNGIKCETRLSAIMRIIEHELIHILEFRAYGKTSCKGERFKSLAFNIFGHTETTHKLIPMWEIAYRQKNLRVGDNVKFNFDGRVFIGIIYRITKRATVMVPSKKGDYIDQSNKRYSKFYVPLNELEKA